VTDDLTAGYDYDLPESLIAQSPAPSRTASRLLVLDRARDSLEHRVFADILEYLRPADCLVLNDTKVIPARLLGALPTGGRVELLLLRSLGGDEWECLARPAGKLRPGRTARFGEGPFLDAEVTAIVDDTGRRRVRLSSSLPVREAIERVGHVPLPPYIRRDDAEPDRERYQTVYAVHPGSAAAPTAGLHFDEDLLRRLEGSGVRVARLTLHVGLGTFRPITADRLDQHTMHSESYVVSEECAQCANAAREAGGRIVAVGTTSVRTLESASDTEGRLHPCTGETELFIRPGHRFRAVDALLTNFHLPRSSLLVLVSALAGRERVLAAYREAVARGYRFFSYGDAMLIL